MYACKLCYRSVGAKPVSGKTDPVYGINKRIPSFVEGTRGTRAVARIARKDGVK